MKMLKCDVDGPIMTITIQRPEVKNAINNALAADLEQALELLDRRDDVRVAILTGADATFCAEWI
jgi:enoyl-CoA hydratase